MLPATRALHPRVRALREALDLSEIGLIEGQAHADDAGDPHYLEVDGRLVYGEQVLALTDAATRTSA